MDARDRYEQLEGEVYGEAGSERRVRTVHNPASDGSVRVVECGSGRPVLFVHGGGGMGASFAPLLPHLRGIAAIVPDRPGFGGSGPVDHRTVHLRRFAVDTLIRVLDDLRLDRVDVAGTSMGGLWALWLALDHPDRVDRVVQLACPALVVGTSAPLPLRLMGTRRLGPPMLHATPAGRKGVEQTLRMLGEPAGTIAGLSRAYVDLFADAMSGPNFEMAWLSLLGTTLRLTGGDPRWALHDADLATVRKPVLAIWGGRDPFGDLRAARRFARVTGAELIELPEAGHLPWLDAPAQVGAAISRFLDRAADGPVAATAAA